MMAMHDKKGRAYVRLIDIKAGDTIETDVDFDCMKPGKKVVAAEGQRLYVSCKKGCHFLDGQDDGDGYLVGMYGVDNAHDAQK